MTAENLSKNAKKLKDVLRGQVEALGCECVGIDVQEAKSGAVLRIYIDTPEGVGHTLCETVSRAVTEYLDRCEEEDRPWFDGKYFVEVSSPGLERPLFTPEHYARFIGRRAEVRTKDRRRITGDILSCDDTAVTLGPEDGDPVTLSFEEIRRGNLVYVMEKGIKKTNKSGGKSKKKPS